MNATVVAGFLVRDGYAYLKGNLNALCGVLRMFRDYRIEYVENDSSDGTRTLLRDAAVVDTRVSGIMLDNVSHVVSSELCNFYEPNCATRVNLMATLRQRLLTRMLAWESDFTLMLDFDFVRFSYNDFWTLFAIFTRYPDADGAFGMSVNAADCHLPYDTGALGHVFSSEYEDSMAQIASCKVTPVTSAFSGFGVYRTAHIQDVGAHYVATG